MHDRASLLVPGLVTLDASLEREFETRLVETSRLAFRVAFSVLRHQEDAEDVAQESFAKAYRHFTSLRDRDRFRAWLVRTVWRTALDRQRSNRRRGAHELVVEPVLLAQAPTREAFPRPAADHDHAALWTAIDALPEKLRQVIVLASIQGHDVREVAGLLRIPEGTVKSRLFLARRRLKEALR
jgi:RNA polymerase sigma-70 factor, ECF subfamily